MLTSIYYVEDIDSLRFALAANEFDVTALQPHFPGYPAYCFFLKICYLLTHSVGFSFSILGGISIFLLLYFGEKLWELLTTKDARPIQILLFLNPLLWLMSNRYMPDIMGLALLVMGAYFMVRALKVEANRLQVLMLFGFVVGFEAGVRLSYIPFFLPALLLCWYFPRRIPQMGLAMVAGIAVWLLPFVWITGLDELMEAGKVHTEGHFTDWGGGVMSEGQSYAVRFNAMVKSIWADGLGAWWPLRHWLTIVLSVGLGIGMLNGLRVLSQKKSVVRDVSVLLLMACLLVYSLWAFFFQNIIYKPRHVMPLLPFLSMLIAYGWVQLIEKGPQWRRVTGLSFLLCMTIVTGVLVIQHRKPSAISQLKTWL
ncbi:MAG: hypothetical protein AAF570_26255, partial [Bacteroidota bacterium]